MDKETLSDKVEAEVVENGGAHGGHREDDTGSGSKEVIVGEKIQSNNQIFVQGLPTDATEEDIARFFGSIGLIKNDKKTGKQRTFIFKDNNSGMSKGKGLSTK